MESMPTKSIQGVLGPCSCLADTVSLASGLPMTSEVPFESVIKIGKRATETWEGVSCCRRCFLDLQIIRIFLGTVERLLALYEAASIVYGMNSPFLSRVSTSNPLPRSTVNSASGSPRPPTCTKSHITLGEIYLEDEEAGLLAGIVLSDGLVKLGGLLRDLRDNLRGAQGHPTAQFAANEMEAIVNTIILRLQAVLGRIRSRIA